MVLVSETLLGVLAAISGALPCVGSVPSPLSGDAKLIA